MVCPKAFQEPGIKHTMRTKFVAKLRDYKTNDNLLLLKTEMNAGHGGKTGRDSVIEEIALDYAFALKISGKINS